MAIVHDFSRIINVRIPFINSEHSLNVDAKPLCLADKRGFHVKMTFIASERGPVNEPSMS